MKNWEELISPNLLKAHVWGETTPEMSKEIMLMADIFPVIKVKLNELFDEMMVEVFNSAIEPDPIIRPFVVATADYITRLNKGEPFVLLPELTPSSTAEDYRASIEREDMVPPSDLEGIYAKILSAVPDQLTTALVWLTHMAPQETHHDEYERFLVLEGTCTIIIDGVDNYLGPGDYLQIPLHKNHHVMVTSPGPCKILLQRVKVTG